MTLDEDTFIMFASRHYDIGNMATIDDFIADTKRFKYLRKLFSRYKNKKELRVRLILNHLVVIYNCFGDAATPMLFYKLADHLKELKPFLICINRLPETVVLNGQFINTVDIQIDEVIVKELRELLRNDR